MGTAVILTREHFSVAEGGSLAPGTLLETAPCGAESGVPMASLSRALRVAATCPRRSRTRGLGLRALTGQAGPAAEKSVPYRRTLKDPQGPSTVARGPSQPLPSTAHVVVIGGGSLGCQTLYHLAKLGVSGAVLLERERLTSGTTWHTAGLLWQLRPSDVEVELLAHTRRVVSHDLEEETGLHTGWIQNGGLFIASNRQRLDEYKRLMSLGKAYGVESHVLSPAETKALYPLMNVDDLYGTLYVPHDGTMDPAGTCTALTRAAAARGAQVIENCPVTGIRVRTDDFGVRRVTAVETEHGSIQTPCVVNCAGVWASAVGRMAGVKVPLVAMHHAYVVTERIEGIQVHRLWEAQGPGSESYPALTPKVVLPGAVSQCFAMFCAPGLAGARSHAEALASGKPFLNIPGQVASGPAVSSTPTSRSSLQDPPLSARGSSTSGLDGRTCPLLAPASNPTPSPAHHISIALAPTALRRVRKHSPPRPSEPAAHKAEQEPVPRAQAAMRLGREAPESGKNASRIISTFPLPLLHGLFWPPPWQGGRSSNRQGQESPGTFRKVPVLQMGKCPGSSPANPWGPSPSLGSMEPGNYRAALGSPSPATAGHRNKGCSDNIAQPVGHLLPSKAGVRAEAWGPGARRLTVRSLSVPPLWFSMQVYTVEPGGKRKTRSVGAARHSPARTSLVPAYTPDPARARHRDAYKRVPDALHQEKSEAWEPCVRFLLLPALTPLFPPRDFQSSLELCPWRPHPWVLGGQGRGQPVRMVTEGTGPGSPDPSLGLSRALCPQVRAMRLSFVGELGWELHVPKPACVPVYRAVMAAGTKHGLVNAGYRAIDSLSIEKGYRHWHADLRPDDSPLEAGLAFTCKLKSAVPFLGREALEKQRAEGLRRRLVCFTVDEKVPMFGLEAIWRNGQVVGHVRRADFGFAVDKTLAYGYIRDPSGQSVSLDFVKSGDYALERMGVAYPARAHLKSPFDPDNKRVKGIY
uniref:sarcosine dehydrogenase, mitochondrial-like n=1 Tax=Panthera onca TaxID=9690 RepID=UPI002953FA8E|nr:sarcosine dehydrogenase, mitochondrial-like [Panthera onca]